LGFKKSQALLDLDLLVFDGDGPRLNEPLDLQVFNRNDLVHAMPKDDDMLPRIVVELVMLFDFQNPTGLVNRLHARMTFDSGRFGDDELRDVLCGGGLHLASYYGEQLKKVNNQVQGPQEPLHHKRARSEKR
jgi:hypothetical protein